MVSRVCAREGVPLCSLRPFQAWPWYSVKLWRVELCIVQFIVLAAGDVVGSDAVVWDGGKA